VDLTFHALQGQGTAGLTAAMDAACALFPMGLPLGFGSGSLAMRFQSPTPQPPQDGDEEFFLGAVICPFYTYA
jgi:hypothetical protein